MACASAIERNRLVATTLASASLLPELQTLRTSKSRFQHLPRHGSSYPRFAGTGEPATRSYPGDSPEIDDHHSPSAAVQQQIRRLQRLLKPLPRLNASATASHLGR